MSRSRSGKRYDAEFKQEVVRLLLSSGKPATQLASELGVSSWSLSQWKQEYFQALEQSTVPASHGSVRSAGTPSVMWTDKKDGNCSTTGGETMVNLLRKCRQ